MAPEKQSKGRSYMRHGQLKNPAAFFGRDAVCHVIANPAPPGVAIQPDGLYRRPLAGFSQ
jgi:hypothetical protein